MNDLATRSSLSLHRLPTDDTGGVDPRSRYVDHYWMPILGPAAICLARTLMRMISRRAGEVRVELDHLRSVLGLGGDPAGQLGDALDALAVRGIVILGDEDQLFVRADFPRLSDTQAAELPEALAAAHRSPGSLLAAVSLDAPHGAARSPGPHARALSLAATIDEILVNPSLDAGQLAHRWQHVIRLAEEARDDAVLDWVPGDLEATLAECHLAGQAVTEAIWMAQRAVAENRRLGDESRAGLTDAAAGIIDWMVAEFPPEPPRGGVAGDPLDLDDL